MSASHRTPPGPRRQLGSLFRLRRDPLGFLSSLAGQFGDAVRYRVGPEQVFLFSHPDLVQDVLVNQNRKFMKGQALQEAKRILGNGLLTSEGEFHARQRRRIQPLFRQEQIESFASVMTGYALRAQERWRQEAPIDIAEEMSRLTLSIAGKTLLDADVEAEAQEIGEELTAAMDILHRRFLSPFSGLLYRVPLPATRRFRAARRRLDAVVLRLVAEHRQDQGRKDLLSLILRTEHEQEGPRMTDGQVRDEAMTIILAGHETTAQALTWTWYLLSGHPQVEARLHGEIAAVLGGRDPTHEDLPRLPYTRRVLAEAMRLYPPAWIIGRRALQDCFIGPYAVPERSIVTVSQFIVHRDERFFPEPERFDPDRWTPEAEAERHRYSYFPFGGGSRACIGERFAWTEGILVLATIAQRWQLRLVAGHPVAVEPRITLRPRFGMRMTPLRRTGIAPVA